MVNYWQYIGTAQLPTEVPAAVKDEWETTLKAEMTRIYSNLLTKIPSEVLFKDRIADASSDQFEAFLATVGGAWDADEIKMKQRVKLNRQYAQWLANVQACFGGASPYFGDRVTSKKQKYDLARYTLGVVGLRYQTTQPYTVWGIASKGALFLRGDTRPKRYIGTHESFTGTLENVCDTIGGRYGTPAMIAETVKACVMAKFADEGGLTTVRDNIITAHNTVLDKILQGFLNTAHLTPPKDVTWVLSWDAVNTHVKLTVTDIH